MLQKSIQNKKLQKILQKNYYQKFLQKVVIKWRYYYKESLQKIVTNNSVIILNNIKKNYNFAENTTLQKKSYKNDL